MKQMRQGDTFWEKITESKFNSILTSNRFKKDDKRTVLEGELTGHTHQTLEGLVFRNQDKNAEVQALVQTYNNTKLIHQEHPEIPIPAGWWMVTRQREFDGQTERGLQRTRNVFD